MAELTHTWRNAGLALVVLGTAATLAPARAQTVLVPVPTAQAQVVIAPTAPPPPQVEVIPPAPSTAVVWQPGRQFWNGTGWTWQPGHYETRPQPASVWVPGQWQPAAGGGYSWVEGHWQ